MCVEEYELALVVVRMIAGKTLAGDLMHDVFLAEESKTRAARNIPLKKLSLVLKQGKIIDSSIIICNYQKIHR